MLEGIRIINNACDILGLDVVYKVIKRNLTNEFLRGELYFVRLKNGSFMIFLKEELEEVDWEIASPYVRDYVRDLYSDWLMMRDVIKLPKILLKDNIITAELHTWTGIGGVVKKWRIELTEEEK